MAISSSEPPPPHPHPDDTRHTQHTSSSLGTQRLYGRMSAGAHRQKLRRTVVSVCRQRVYDGAVAFPMTPAAEFYGLLCPRVHMYCTILSVHSDTPPVHWHSICCSGIMIAPPDDEMSITNDHFPAGGGSGGGGRTLYPPSVCFATPLPKPFLSGVGEESRAGGDAADRQRK